MDAKQFVLVLQNIRSTYNVGSIFRTADGAGVDKIYLCGYTPTPAQKTALGAQASIDWQSLKQTKPLLKKLKAQGFTLLALEQNAKSKNLFDYKITGPTALIVGNEVNGIKNDTLKSVDAILEIPMGGQKESLNVAVATGIALYELRKNIL